MLYLKDSDTAQSLRVSQSSRFQSLQDLYKEDQWNDIRESINKTCAEVLRNKATEHKEWITPGTMESISKRKYLMEECNKSRTRREKAEAQKYKAANREVKQKINHDKREYYNTSATKEEEAAAHGCMKFLYDTTRKLASKFQQTSSQVKDKEGNISTSDDEQLKRWAQYFYEL